MLWCVFETAHPAWKGREIITIISQKFKHHKVEELQMAVDHSKHNPRLTPV